ncbi:MAG: glycosyltransferase family 4 protein, partial [Acidimicrobiales bacterium]
MPVPPPSYGGTELVLDVLARGLVRAGHEVVLFTTGDATCDVPRQWLFEHCDPDRIGVSVLELRHVAAAYEALQHCDLVHDHTLSGLFVSELYPETPVVTTNHGPFNEDLVDIYRQVVGRIPIIGISRHQASTAPAEVPVSTVIHHGLDLDRYPYSPHGGDYLLALGRMNHDKGIDRAIHIARRAGMPLLIAAKMREPAEQRYFAEVIEPHLDDRIRYVGEVGHADKVRLLQGARALLNPIRWPEPFGLVMIEALACGTPVVSTYHGAAPEIVTPGETGFLSDDEGELVRAVLRAGGLSRAACRARAEREFSAERMVADHVAFFHTVAATRGRRVRVPATAAASPAPPPALTPAAATVTPAGATVTPAGATVTPAGATVTP